VANRSRAFSISRGKCSSCNLNTAMQREISPCGFCPTVVSLPPYAALHRSQLNSTVPIPGHQASRRVFSRNSPSATRTTVVRPRLAEHAQGLQRRNVGVVTRARLPSLQGYPRLCRRYAMGAPRTEDVAEQVICPSPVAARTRNAWRGYLLLGRCDRRVNICQKLTAVSNCRERWFCGFAVSGVGCGEYHLFKLVAFLHSLSRDVRAFGHVSVGAPTYRIFVVAAIMVAAIALSSPSTVNHAHHDSPSGHFH
jgi:hypothetical protein